MLHMTPDAYIQVRRTNGVSWAMSGVRAASRAITIETPVLKTACRARAGTASSQEGRGYWPKASRISTSAPSEKSSCWSCCRASAIGREARGKCRARTRPMLPLIARVPTVIDELVKVQMKTPVTRNGT